MLSFLEAGRFHLVLITGVVDWVKLNALAAELSIPRVSHQQLANVRTMSEMG